MDIPAGRLIPCECLGGFTGGNCTQILNFVKHVAACLKLANWLRRSEIVCEMNDADRETR